MTDFLKSCENGTYTFSINYSDTQLSKRTLSKGLHIAAEKGHLDVVKQLLKYYQEQIGDTMTGISRFAIMHAMQNKHLEVVKLLLTYATPMDTFKKQDYDLLIIATRTGDVEIAELLYIYYNSIIPVNIMSHIFADALYYGHIKLARVFYSWTIHIPDIDIAFGDGFSSACIRGNINDALTIYKWYPEISDRYYSIGLYSFFTHENKIDGDINSLVKLRPHVTPMTFEPHILLELIHNGNNNKLQLFLKIYSSNIDIGSNEYMYFQSACLNNNIQIIEELLQYYTPNTQTLLQIINEPATSYSTCQFLKTYLTKY
jgi:ankyrin repeat protein